MTIVTTTAGHHSRPAAGHGTGFAQPPPHAPGRPELVISLAAGSLLIAIGLWVAGGGLSALGNAPLTSLGRLTGLLAADLLLIQVLLMARIPWVERSFGQDLLARRHRTAGFTSFWLMITHILLVTLGYAAADGNGALEEAWQLVTTAPGMLLAAAGTAALATVEPRCCIVWCLTFITTTSTCVGPRHGLRHCAPASPAPGSPRRRCIPSSSPGRER